MKQQFWICCIALALTACKKQSGEKPGISSTPDVTAAGNPIGAAKQQVVGPAGGTIVSEDGKLSLTIPSQALENEVTISMQPIESKLQTGLIAYRFLPHGLQFRKKAGITWRYDAEDGIDPNLLLFATQQDDGSWMIIKDKSVDRTAQTVSVHIEHFSDYSLASQAFLIDSKSKSPYGVLPLKSNEEVSFSLKCLDPDPNSIFVPIPRTDIKLQDWAINGGLESPNPYMFGRFTAISGDSAVYKAPAAAPPGAENMIAISAKPTVKLSGLDVTLIKYVTIEDVNSFKWNRESYSISHLGGTFGRVSGNHLALAFPTANPVISLGVAIAPEASGNPPFEGYTGPGTYNFSQKNIILTFTDGHGVSFTNRWGTRVTSGKIEILPGSGTRNGDPIYGRISGTLKNWPDGPQGTISVNFEGALSQ